MTVRTNLPERVWFGFTALAVLVGMVAQSYAVAGDSTQFYHSVPGRIFTMFCFFTIESNVLVGIVSLLTAIRGDRTSTAFHVWRLVALVCIVITGVVYHLVLAGASHPVGAGLFANDVQHTLVPLLFPLVWLIFGPRGRLTGRHVAWALAPPIGWLVYTFARGAIVHWYPYPFMDVGAIGYPKSLLHCVFVALLLLVLAGVALVVDRVTPAAVRHDSVSDRAPQR